MRNMEHRPKAVAGWSAHTHTHTHTEEHVTAVELLIFSQEGRPHTRYWKRRLSPSTLQWLSYAAILVWRAWGDPMRKNWMKPTAMHSSRQICGRWTAVTATTLCPGNKWPPVYCIHYHNSGKQCQILTEFWNNNAMSNCKQITKFK